MKPTRSTWLLIIMSVIAIGIASLSCRNFQRSKAVNEGSNRPMLSTASVKADHLLPYPGRENNPWEFPLFVVRFKNDGNASARLTEAGLKSYLPSRGCDLSFEGNQKMNIVIPPGHEDQALMAVKVTLPCKTSGLIKFCRLEIKIKSKFGH